MRLRLSGLFTRAAQDPVLGPMFGPVLRASLLLAFGLLPLSAMAQTVDRVPLEASSPPAIPPAAPPPAPPPVAYPALPPAPAPENSANRNYSVAPLPPQATMETVDAATTLNEPEQLLQKAQLSIESLQRDKNYTLLNDLLSRAKAVLIAPNLIRLGFFIGGRGGAAVLLVRDDAGNWSQPAFYTIGGVSYGFQIGAQASELVICIMSEKGLNALMDTKFTLGADAGVAVLDVGAGAQAATGLDYKADMYSFSRSDGLYAGISLDGSVITPKDSYNHLLYGPQASPRAILIDRSFTAPQANGLIRALP